MFRKLMIAAAAVASLGTAALMPTSASAGWYGYHGGYGYWRVRPWVGFAYYGNYDANRCVMQRRLIMTRHGERWRWQCYCY